MAGTDWIREGARAAEYVRYGTDRLCKDHRGGVSEVLSTLDEIEALVAVARRRIQNVEG